jgi:glycosyltransferase involved in cell wall biosynthesis
MPSTVAIVANSSWNIYNFRQPLLKAFTRAGHRVIVIAPVDEYIRYLNEHHFAKHIPLRQLAPQSKNPLRDLLLLLELVLIYRREKPDLILHFTAKPNIYGSIAARWTGCQSVPTMTGLGYAFLHGKLLNQIVRKLYQFALRGVQKALFHNQDDRRLFHEQQIIPKERSAVVPGSGLNTNHFRPLPRPFNSKTIFLFMGRMLYDKGIREYAEAARLLRQQYPNAECWMLGQMDVANPAALPRPQLLEWVESKTIRYLGSTNDVRPYLKQCDVLVLPSYREGMPRALLEAMAMGKPVITTDVPGCREAITPECGWLIPVRDAHALRDAMLKAAAMPAHQREAMGQKARQRARQTFDEQVVIQHYLKLLQPPQTASKQQSATA